MPKFHKSQQASGIEFQLRPGAPPFGQSGWRGVNTEDDPSALDPNELQRGENIRLYGKDIIPRFGLKLLIDLGPGYGNADNHIEFSGEAPVDNPRERLWFCAKGCFGSGIGTGSAIYHLDPSEIPAVQQYARLYSGNDFQSVLGGYGGELYIGDRTTLRRALLITPHPAVATNQILFSPSQQPIADFPGYRVRCLLEFDSKLFIGLENLTVPGASKIVVWNGGSVKDDLTGIRPPLAFGIFQNRLVAGFDATAGNIQARAIGDAPGTWTPYALAGFQCGTQGNVMQEERQYLYIASGKDKIYKFSGTALTLAQTIATCATDGNGVTGLTLFRGLLYYGWNGAGPGYLSRLGRHDPDSTATEWTDTYKDISAEQPNFIMISALKGYRRRIYCGGIKVYVLATAADDPQGTLRVVNGSGAPGAGFEVDQFVRFP